MVVIKDRHRFKLAVEVYWRYYLELEGELIGTDRYVSIDPRNGATFSIEYNELFQAICSEVETVAKSMANLMGAAISSSARVDITDWWFPIQDAYRFDSELRPTHPGDDSLPSLAEAEVSLLGRHNVVPWNGFRCKRKESGTDSGGGKGKLAIDDVHPAPDWWHAHNDLKHARSVLLTDGEEIKQRWTNANQRNTVRAISGLYVLEMAMLESIGTDDDLDSLHDESALFNGRVSSTGSFPTH